MVGPLDEGPERATSVEDLHKVFDCWTRVEIVAALAGPELSVHVLAERLGLGDSLLSTHLAALHADGLAQCEVRGQHHYWSLTDAAQVVATGEGLSFALSSE